MSFVNTMKGRYTTKMYDPNKKIDAQKIEDLKEILRLSPSSINSQPWSFVFVSDPETKEKLAAASMFNDKKVIQCDTLVVFRTIDSIEKFENQIKKHLAQGAVDYFQKLIKPMPKEQITAWFEKQVYLSLGFFMAACADMDIDSTPMEGILPEKYDEILGSDGYRTLVAVAIGKRDPEDKNQIEIKPKSRLPLEEVVISI